MSINLAVADATFTHLKPRIVVIGVGGGGGNAVNNMINKNLEGVDFIVANTDAQALAHSAAGRKIQLGLEITQGLGAGARPEIGRMAAEEAKDEIEKALDGANMVFITAGMGGGTGSGAAPLVAKIAKEKGILTVGVVTKPFEFEGKKRMVTAENAISEFTDEVDSIIIIPNQNLFRIANENTTLTEAFMLADNVLYSGVRSITDLMMMPGLMNLDFADIRTTMEGKGKAIMGTGEAEGEGRARIAAEQALSNPLLDDCSISGAKSVLINITGGNDLTLMEVQDAAGIIKAETDDSTEIIFGSSYDDALEGKIRVSIVVTGIDAKSAPKAKDKSVDTSSYINDSYVPAVEPAQNADSQMVAANLERFAANSQPAVVEEEVAVIEETPADETIKTVEQSEVIPTEDNNEISQEESSFAQEIVQENPDFSKFEDFDMLEKSAEISDAPKASDLFNAIMNKSTAPHLDDEKETEEKSIDDYMPADDDIFTSKTSINTVDEDPVLFPAQDEPVFAPKVEKKEEATAPISDKPNFIDKILGISRARKNRKEQYTPPEQVSPRFGTDLKENENTDSEIEDLDIPAFLRRK